MLLALGKINAVKFQHDLAPEAQWVGFIKDEVEAAANGAPFALKDVPGGMGGGGDLFGRGLAGAPLGAEIGNFVFNECAD